MQTITFRIDKQWGPTVSIGNYIQSLGIDQTLQCEVRWFVVEGLERSYLIDVVASDSEWQQRWPTEWSTYLLRKSSQCASPLTELWFPLSGLCICTETMVVWSSQATRRVDQESSRCPSIWPYSQLCPPESRNDQNTRETIRRRIVNTGGLPVPFDPSWRLGKVGDLVMVQTEWFNKLYN